HVRYYLNLEHTQPFQNEVSAYPAILVVDRELTASTHAATLDELSSELFDEIRDGKAWDGGHPVLSEFSTWYTDGSPWITTSKTSHASWERLADRHPTLEESAARTRVGIGVATGADKVFI